MEFHLRLLVFISLALVSSHAASPSEVYWQSVLPNKPMPKAIQDLLPEEKSVSVGVQHGHSPNSGQGGVSVGVGGGQGVSVGIGHKGSSPYVRVRPPFVKKHPGGSFDYKYAASEDQLHDNPNVALFFLEKDLHPGKKMSLHFTKTIAGAKFLPRQVADAIPFSSNKLSEILNRLSVEPESEAAQVMKKTIEECEEPAMEGEKKFCATSLEAMIDFSTSKLGRNARAVSTEVDKEESQQQQEFTVSLGVKKMVAGNITVVCHGQNYVYPVFLCHATQTTRAYLVPLVGADGLKAKAVAVCHTDTSDWNPKHLAFQVLKVEPGSVPICHFLPEDHIVWVSN